MGGQKSTARMYNLGSEDRGQKTMNYKVLETSTVVFLLYCMNNNNTSKLVSRRMNETWFRAVHCNWSGLLVRKKVTLVLLNWIHLSVDDTFLKSQCKSWVSQWLTWRKGGHHISTRCSSRDDVGRSALLTLPKVTARVNLLVYRIRVRQ